MLGYAVFEVDNLFDEIKTKALRCKVESEFRRVINSKLQKLIEKLEGLSSGEHVGELGVFKSDWNQIPPKDLVDKSFLQLCSLSTSVKVLLDKTVSSDFIGKFQATKLDVSLLEKLKTILMVLHEAVETLTLRLCRQLWLNMLEYVVFELYNCSCSIDYFNNIQLL